MSVLHIGDKILCVVIKTKQNVQIKVEKPAVT